MRILDARSFCADLGLPVSAPSTHAYAVRYTRLLLSTHSLCTMAPKRPSPTSKPRWAQRSGLPRTPARPKLSESSLKWLSKQMQEQYGWKDEPRLFQLEGAQAQLEGTDMIIQAPTGAGKTAVAAGPHLWPGSQGKVTIMVCPLLALEDEMVRHRLPSKEASGASLTSVTGLYLSGRLRFECDCCQQRVWLSDS